MEVEVAGGWVLVGEVAGAVEAGAGWAVGVGGEAGGGEGGVVVVAAGEAGAGDVELAGGAGWDGLEVGVEEVGGQVGQGWPMGLEVVGWWPVAGSREWWVTWMVVSVMPYMLMTAGV